LEKISAELEGASLGILCLTRDNLASPWLLFEAGALSHRFGTRRVCPFLFGLQPTELTFPLAQFQATKETEDSWTNSAEDAADAYARAGDPHWKHPKHGPDDEVGTCEYCDADAVVSLDDQDEVGYVRQKIGALWRALKLELGAGVAGFSICFSCGEVHYGQPEKIEPSW
jgi:hypothetical protein